MLQRKPYVLKCRSLNSKYARRVLSHCRRGNAQNVNAYLADAGVAL